jgi:hypothetical protein
MASGDLFDFAAALPPLRGTDDEWTRDSVLVRLSAIVRETAADNADAPPALLAALRATLAEPLAAGGALPRVAPSADGLWRDGEGGAGAAGAVDVLAAPWFLVETYTYRVLNELFRGAGVAADPFAAAKRRALAAAEPALAARFGPGEPPAAGLAPLILRSLWGNKSDLAFTTGVATAVAAAAADDLLCDDSAAAAAALGAAARVALVVDNCGAELLCDLELADALLARGARVSLFVKAEPTFVSDATADDVPAHVAFAAAAGARALAARLTAALATGTLAVRGEPFFNSPRAMWEAPPRLCEELAAHDVAIFKCVGCGGTRARARARSRRSVP